MYGPHTASPRGPFSTPATQVHLAPPLVWSRVPVQVGTQLSPGRSPWPRVDPCAQTMLPRTSGMAGAGGGVISSVGPHNSPVHAVVITSGQLDASERRTQTYPVPQTLVRRSSAYPVYVSPRTATLSGTSSATAAPSILEVAAPSIPEAAAPSIPETAAELPTFHPPPFALPLPVPDSPDSGGTPDPEQLLTLASEFAADLHSALPQKSFSSWPKAGELPSASLPSPPPARAEVVERASMASGPSTCSFSVSDSDEGDEFVNAPSCSQETEPATSCTGSSEMRESRALSVAPDAAAVPHPRHALLRFSGSRDSSTVEQCDIQLGPPESPDAGTGGCARIALRVGSLDRSPKAYGPFGPTLPVPESPDASAESTPRACCDSD